MDEGLGESQDVSETEPPPYKNTSLEEEVYSKKYIELNGFLQNINPEVKSSRDLERNIRTYFEIGKIAKDGLEKASEIYNENSEPFNESLYLLEKTQTPTLLHKYFESINRFNKNFVKEKLKDFEYEIRKIAFTYRGQVEKRYKKGLPKKIKLSHSEGLDYILEHCNREEIQTRNDVIEALMLAQEIGSEVTIHRWDRRRVDNKRAGELAYNLFERYYSGSKIELYNRFKDKLSKKFGRTMSKSTFYRYIKENKETISMPSTIEPDIQEIQRSIG